MKQKTYIYAIVCPYCNTFVKHITKIEVPMHWKLRELCECGEVINELANKWELWGLGVTKEEKSKFRRVRL